MKTQILTAACDIWETIHMMLIVNSSKIKELLFYIIITTQHLN